MSLSALSAYQCRASRGGEVEAADWRRRRGIVGVIRGVLAPKKRVLRSSAGDVNKSSSGERLREKRRCVSWGKQTEIDLFKKKIHEKNRGKRSFMSATDLNFAVFMAVFANRPTVVFAIITPTNIHPFQRFCTATVFFSSSRQSVEKKRKRRDAKICRSMQNHVLWLINRVCLFTFLTSQKFRLACVCVRVCVSLSMRVYIEKEHFVTTPESVSSEPKCMESAVSCCHIAAP